MSQSTPATPLALSSLPDLLTREDLAGVLQIHVSTVSAWLNAGRLPAPMKLGDRAVRWRKADVGLWLELGCPDRKAFEARKRAMGR